MVLIVDKAHNFLDPLGEAALVGVIEGMVIGRRVTVLLAHIEHTVIADNRTVVIGNAGGVGCAVDGVSCGTILRLQIARQGDVAIDSGLGCQGGNPLETCTLGVILSTR